MVPRSGLGLGPVVREGNADLVENRGLQPCEGHVVTQVHRDLERVVVVLELRRDRRGEGQGAQHVRSPQQKPARLPGPGRGRWRRPFGHPRSSRRGHGHRGRRDGRIRFGAGIVGRQGGQDGRVGLSDGVVARDVDGPSRAAAMAASVSAEVY